MVKSALPPEGFTMSMPPQLVPLAANQPLYETDFYAWTEEQAAYLQTGQWDKLDRGNLAEEVAALGRQERRELENRLAILLAHLLKWQYQPSHRSNSWIATIREQRYQIQRLWRQSPSLKAYLDEALVYAYDSGLNLAVKETNLDFKTFPESCPYALPDILTNDFLPGADAQ
jgi:hypothetical protein